MWCVPRCLPPWRRQAPAGRRARSRQPPPLPPPNFFLHLSCPRARFVPQARRGLCGAEAVAASGVCAGACGRCVLGPLPAAPSPASRREADQLAACSPERHLLAALDESREITLFSALLHATGVAAHLNASHVDVALLVPADGPLGRHLAANGINATGLSDATRDAARGLLLRHVLPGAKSPPALFARAEHQTASGGRLFTVGGRYVTGGGDGGAELLSYAHLCASSVYTIGGVLLPGPPPEAAVPSALLAAEAAAKAAEAPEAEAAALCAQLSSAGAAARLRPPTAASKLSPRCLRP